MNIQPAKFSPDTLTFRFEIEDWSIFQVRGRDTCTCVHSDIAIFSAWASLNGRQEFSLGPPLKCRLKLVSRLPLLESTGAYIIRKSIGAGWANANLSGPFQKKKLVPHWVYKEGVARGLPHLAAITYAGTVLHISGGQKTLREQIAVAQQALHSNT